jgi:hypothetical protein
MGKAPYPHNHVRLDLVTPPDLTARSPVPHQTSPPADAQPDRAHLHTPARAASRPWRSQPVLLRPSPTAPHPPDAGRSSSALAQPLHNRPTPADPPPPIVLMVNLN